MFPNSRLIVVAILAAIVGIGCGLGLFATFRINHEPLERLAEGSPPLQLAFDNRTLGSDTRAPLKARLPVDGAAKVISVPVIIATPSPAAEEARADSTTAGDSSAQRAAAGAVAVDQSNTASLAVAVPAEQSGVTPETIAPGQQEAVAAVPDQQPAASAATPSAAEQTAAVNAAAEDQQPAANPTTSEESNAAKPAARASRPAARARRAAKTVRTRRSVTTAAAQPTYQYSQPTYTWTDGTAQASQSIKRVQIKRHRTAKTTAPTAQSNPSAATAGLSTE
jgi:hypothetical protein